MATDDPIMASVAGRYASALFELASAENKVTEVEAELISFDTLVHESSDLRFLVRSPVFSADDQYKAISAILDKAGMGALAANFLRVVATNRRLFAVSDIIRAYRQLAAHARGEAEADVVSATPLTDVQLDELGKTLRIAVGKEVKIHTRVDPALLGGLIVKFGSRMFDSSIATKLNSLKNRMKEVR